MDLIEPGLCAEERARIGHIEWLVDETAFDEHRGQDEGISRVQRRQHLVPRDRDGLRIRAPALDLDEAQAAGARIAALDVVAAIFR